MSKKTNVSYSGGHITIMRVLALSRRKRVSADWSACRLRVTAVKRSSVRLQIENAVDGELEGSGSTWLFLAHIHSQTVLRVPAVSAQLHTQTSVPSSTIAPQPTSNSESSATVTPWTGSTWFPLFVYWSRESLSSVANSREGRDPRAHSATGPCTLTPRALNNLQHSKIISVKCTEHATHLYAKYPDLKNIQYLHFCLHLL